MNKIKLFNLPTQKVIFLYLLLLLPVSAKGEIVLDGTLGIRKTLVGPDFIVEANMGIQKGNNLFHSFELLNLQANESVTFNGYDTIQRVISRITGGQVSYLNGLLRCTIPQADLFFINPAGIIFGADARLDMSGSFYATTADYLKLGTEGRFDATHSQQSILTTTSPTAFGFLTHTPAQIIKNNSFLFLSANKTLALIGGDLHLQDTQIQLTDGQLLNSFIAVPMGEIQLVSVADVGEIPINFNKLPEKLHLGKITLTDDTQGVNNLQRSIANLDVSGEGGGKITMVAEQIVLDNAYIFADTIGKQAGRGINIQVTGELQLNQASRLTTEVFNPKNITEAIGKAGNITISAKKITINEGSQIASTSQTAQSAGNIAIISHDSVTITGRFSVRTAQGLLQFNSGLLTNTLQQGQGGNITLTTSKLTLTQGGTIRADTRGLGNAGNIRLKIDELQLTTGSKISVSAGNQAATVGTGQGGELTIEATDNINIVGTKEQPSAILSNVFTAGKGGVISISAPNITITQQGQIQSGSDSIGEAGAITIQADNLKLYQAEVSCRALLAEGGNITLHIKKQLNLTDSQISVYTLGQQDNSGNVIIEQPTFTILANSRVLASAISGHGGNIQITTKHLISNQNNELNASSQLGIDGQVTINAPDQDMNDSLMMLPTPFLQAENWLKERCINRSDVENYLVINQFQTIPPPTDLETGHFWLLTISQ